MNNISIFLISSYILYIQIYHISPICLNNFENEKHIFTLKIIHGRLHFKRSWFIGPSTAEPITCLAKAILVYMLSFYISISLHNIWANGFRIGGSWGRSAKFCGHTLTAIYSQIETALSARIAGLRRKNYTYCGCECGIIKLSYLTAFAWS